MTESGSILVADCGSTQTTVALIERVNGHHRLVARGNTISTHRTPWLDMSIGVQAAVRQIEGLVGRRLLAEELLDKDAILALLDKLDMERGS